MKTYRDFIPYVMTRDMRSTYLDKTKTELLALLASYEKKVAHSMTGPSDKARLRPEIWDLKKLIAAHEQAEQFNSTL